MSKPTIAFLSYSQDSNAWTRAAIALAEKLAKDGVDIRLDKYDDSPTEGWPKWMDRQIREASHILVVASELYFKKYNGDVPKDVGKGAKWESLLAVQRMYESGDEEQSVIPVLFDTSDAEYRVAPLRSHTYYCVYKSFEELDFDEDGYVGLYRRITNQPEFVRPPLGPPKVFPPRDIRASRPTEPAPEPDSLTDDTTEQESDVGIGSGGVATATGRAEVIIELDKPIESMSTDEKERLKQRVAAAIDVSPDRLSVVYRRGNDGPDSRGGVV